MASEQQPDPETRRFALIEDMKARSARGIHCGECVGVCCTHLANSMQITREEAEDIRDYLIRKDRWTPALIGKLRETVQRYRLDHEVGDGRRSMRKTYTCPFYAGGNLGCTISPAHKPYGCLAFNPRSPGLTEGGDCASDPSLLEPFAVDAQEKEPIPVALLKWTELPEGC